VALAVRWRPVALEAVRVVARRRCPGGSPDARAAGLFEQARLAFEVERATRAERRFGVAIEEREGPVDGDGQPAGEPTRRIRRGPTTTPFVTAAPDAIFRRGYATAEPDGVTFHAPDADVLLSDAFLETHCLERAAGAPGLLAVGVRSARALPGVGLRGTLWLDSATLALRRFAFRYERLPAAFRDWHPGGELVYDQLAGGRWLVRAWWLRVPAAADAAGRPPAAALLGGPPGTNGTTSSVAQAPRRTYHEVGGARDGGVRARRRPAGLAGPLPGRGRDRRAAGQPRRRSRRARCRRPHAARSHRARGRAPAARGGRRRRPVPDRLAARRPARPGPRPPAARLARRPAAGALGHGAGRGQRGRGPRDALRSRAPRRGVRARRARPAAAS
jgi:hypothetical protein